MPSHPEVLWAQRSHPIERERNLIYLNVNLPDIDEKTLDYDLTENGLSFKCVARPFGGQEMAYEFQIEFHDKVVPSESSRKLSSRSFFMVIRKSKPQTQYWPRLTKQAIKTPFIKVDFEKWVDEEEQFQEDMDNMDGAASQFSGLGGEAIMQDFASIAR